LDAGEVAWIVANKETGFPNWEACFFIECFSYELNQ